MKTVLKWFGITIGGVVALVALAALALYLKGGARLNRSWDITVENVAVPTDSAAIARGRHLAEAVTLCQGCHGANLAGGVVFDQPRIARIYAPNLTAGRGGVGATLSDTDFVRAIRHGVDPTGRGLMVMHADVYHNLSAEDLGAIIAYVKSVPPVDSEVPQTQAAWLGKIFLALGMFDKGPMPLLPAEVIDHSAPLAPMPAQGVTAEYGGYLVSIALCHMCHGADLTGGPPIEEGAPAAPNITPYGAPDGWGEEGFVKTIRTGVTPYGRSLDGDVMPWKVYSHMTDDELGAIWRYIASVARDQAGTAASP